MRHNHTVEQDSSLKKTEVLIHATTWMSLGDICKVKEISHKSPHVVESHLHAMSRIGKSGDGKEIRDCQGQGGAESNYLWVQRFRGEKYFLNLTVVNGCTTLQIH